MLPMFLWSFSSEQTLKLTMKVLRVPMFPFGLIFDWGPFGGGNHLRTWFGLNVLLRCSAIKIQSYQPKCCALQLKPAKPPKPSKPPNPPPPNPPNPQTPPSNNAHPPPPHKRTKERAQPRQPPPPHNRPNTPDKKQPNPPTPQPPPILSFFLSGVERTSPDRFSPRRENEGGPPGMAVWAVL